MDELKNHTLGGFPMTKLKSLMTGTTAIMLLLGVPSWAAEQPGLGIANNDSIYIDGNSLKIVPGKGKGDASALIKKLDAHAVGPGMIIFRSGDKLYIADVSPSVAQTSYASDRYGSDRDTSVSAAQAERDWQEWQRSLRQNSRYGSDRDTSVSAAQAERDWQESLRQNPRYGSDRDTSVSAAQAERDWQDWQRSLRQNSRYGSDRIVIDDPEYADYKLKKIFADNWTASETK
jgi:hypothetical protein